MFLTNPAVIISEDAKRQAKVAAVDLKKDNALKKKDAAAARLAAGVAPRKRAKKNVAVEAAETPAV